jgi:hypothetical protein
MHQDNVYSHAMQPSGKTCLTAERADLSKELQECLLCKIFGFR